MMHLIPYACPAPDRAVSKRTRGAEASAEMGNRAHYRLIRHLGLPTPRNELGRTHRGAENRPDALQPPQPNPPSRIRSGKNTSYRIGKLFYIKGFSDDPLATPFLKIL
jgi:hypothetical protein